MCKYWDEGSLSWRTDGLNVSVQGTTLSCRTPHLTSFGGIIEIPTSADQLLAELTTAMHFNTFTLDEAAALLSSFSFADNPTIMTIIIVLLTLNAASLWCLGWWRGHRAKRRRRRQGRQYDTEKEMEYIDDIKKKLKQLDSTVAVELNVSKARLAYTCSSTGSGSNKKLVDNTAALSAEISHAKLSKSPTSPSPHRRSSSRLLSVSSRFVHGNASAKVSPEPSRIRCQPCLSNEPSTMGAPSPTAAAEAAEQAAPPEAVGAPHSVANTQGTLPAPSIPVTSASGSPQSLDEPMTTPSWDDVETLMCQSPCAMPPTEEAIAEGEMTDGHDLSRQDRPASLLTTCSRIEVASSTPRSLSRPSSAGAVPSARRSMPRPRSAGPRLSTIHLKDGDLLGECGAINDEFATETSANVVRLSRPPSASRLGSSVVSTLSRPSSASRQPLAVTGTSRPSSASRQPHAAASASRPAHASRSQANSPPPSPPAFPDGVNDLDEDTDAEPSLAGRRKVRSLGRRHQELQRIRGLRMAADKYRHKNERGSDEGDSDEALTRRERICALLSEYGQRMLNLARSEHTVVALIAPSEDDEALTHAQMVQIFWNTIGTELFVCCFQYNAPDTHEVQPTPRGQTAAGGTSGGRRGSGGDTDKVAIDNSTFTIAPITALTQGLIASLIALLVIWICVYIFRFGNSRIRKPRRDWSLRGCVAGVLSCLNELRQFSPKKKGMSKSTRLTQQQLQRSNTQQMRRSSTQGSLSARRSSGSESSQAAAESSVKGRAKTREASRTPSSQAAAQGTELTQIGWIILVAGFVVCPGFNLLALCLCRRKRREGTPSSRSGALAVHSTAAPSPPASPPPPVAKGECLSPQRPPLAQTRVTPAASSGRLIRRQSKAKFKVGEEMTTWIADEKRARQRRREAKLAGLALEAQLLLRRKELGWRSPCEYRARLAVSWFINVSIIVLACISSLIYALQFQEKATNNMMMTWLVAYGVTFVIIEPIQIGVLACAPCCFDDSTLYGRLMSRLRFWYNELCAP